MTMKNNTTFTNVVTELRKMIDRDGLIAGDKIPSERELSERLQVGRSSVREALRSLELLGLIETRRGEGTFVRDFRDHQFIKLLSTFILKEDDVQKDVLKTKLMLEAEGLKSFINKATETDFERINLILTKDNFSDTAFFEEIMKVADNNLVLRIWIILQQYYLTITDIDPTGEKTDYESLIASLKSGSLSEAIEIYYEEIRKITS